MKPETYQILPTMASPPCQNFSLHNPLSCVPSIDPCTYKNPLMPRLNQFSNRGCRLVLTLDRLLNMVPTWFENGEICSRTYRTGIKTQFIFEHDQIFMKLSGKYAEQVKWLAVVDHRNRWYINAGPASWTYDYIYAKGERITDKQTINRLVSCDWEAMQMYLV